MLDDETFQTHYDRVRPGLLRFVRARVRDAHAASDLVQEICTKAFRHRADFDETRSFNSWIYAIARNACVDYLRRRVRDPLSGIGTTAPAAPPDLDTLADAESVDPAKAAERSDLVDVVRRELDRLPANRRAALEMKIMEGLTYREVAEALGVPLGTAAFWVREGIEAVTKRLRRLS